MNKDQEAVKLQLPITIGRPIIWAFIFLVLIVGGIEVLTRLSVIKQKLPAPSLGLDNRAFEIQIAYLDKLTEQENSVDCIFLGTSQIRSDIDPEVVANAYKSKTGTELRCFNFGTSGLSNITAADLAQFLIREYQPRLLVLEVSVLLDNAENRWLTTSPWYRRKLGYISLQSWMLDHTLAYPYLMLMTKSVQNPSSIGLDRNISAYGYYYSEEVLDMTQPLTDLEYDRIAHVWDQRTGFTEDAFESMDRLFQLQDDVQFIVVEVPVHHRFINHLNQSEDQYQIMLRKTSSYLERNEISFWPVPPELSIPDDGWRNGNHLNNRGARIYSLWLGSYLGDAVNQGLIESPTQCP
jgi:hypothetical protein